MKVFLGTDHAGFELKEKVKSYLSENGYEVEDLGAFSYEALDDYPDYISKAAKAVSENPDSKGIVFGSSGQGEAMVANKFKNIRCALFYGGSLEMIERTRSHNDSNMLSLGQKFISSEDAIKAVELFLNSPYSNEERHTRRIAKIKKLEQEI
jgi:ribose 5-phosphate isomerase B